MLKNGEKNVKKNRNAKKKFLEKNRKNRKKSKKN